MTENSMRFHISSLQERFHRGKLLGYKITYFQLGREDNKTAIQVDPSTQTVTLSSLVNGKIYVVFIAGFTSTGTGPSSRYAATCKSMFSLLTQGEKIEEKRKKVFTKRHGGRIGLSN